MVSLIDLILFCSSPCREWMESYAQELYITLTEINKSVHLQHKRKTQCQNKSDNVLKICMPDWTLSANDDEEFGSWLEFPNTPDTALKRFENPPLSSLCSLYCLRLSLSSSEFWGCELFADSREWDWGFATPLKVLYMLFNRFTIFMPFFAVLAPFSIKFKVLVIVPRSPVTCFSANLKSFSARLKTESSSLSSSSSFSLASSSSLKSSLSSSSLNCSSCFFPRKRLL